MDRVSFFSNFSFYRLTARRTSWLRFLFSNPSFLVALLLSALCLFCQYSYHTDHIIQTIRSPNNTLEEIRHQEGMQCRCKMENAASTNNNVAPLPRRRRKRARGTAVRPVDENERPNPANAKTSQTSKRLLNLDDKELTFLDQDGDFLTDRKAIRRSVTFLLEERRIGQWTGKIPIWQRQTLQTTIKKPEKGDPRRQWRSYGKRMIPFTQLGTPHSDAVLSMARQDSFVLCLGTKDLRNAPLALAIRFFGEYRTCFQYLSFILF